MIEPINPRRRESFFGGLGIGGVALEQDFAAGPVELRFERAVAEAIGRRKRFIEGSVANFDVGGGGGLPRSRCDGATVDGQASFDRWGEVTC
jgi:hypothetical protein